MTAAGLLRCYLLLGGRAPAFLASVLLGAGAAIWSLSLPRPSKSIEISPDREKGSLLEPSIAAVGLGGILSLAFFRFVGINAGDAAYLLEPGPDTPSLFWALALISLSIAAWAALAGAAASLAGRRLPAGRTAPLLWLAAAAGTLVSPAAGLLLNARLGPEAAVVLPSLVLLAAALLSAGKGLIRRPIFSRLGPAALIAGLWLAAAHRDTVKDIWLNRLNAALPGGRFLAFEDDGREILGLYEFSSGLRISLTNGRAVTYDEASSRLSAHWPLLFHPKPASLLLVGVRSPAVIAAASRHDVAIEALDAHAGYETFVKAWFEDGLPRGEGIAIKPDPGWQSLRAGETAFDVILAEVALSKPWPNAAPWTERDFSDALRARLNPRGLLAVRILRRHPAAASAFLDSVQGVFAHTGCLPLADGLLFFGSDSPLLNDPVELGTELGIEVDKEIPFITSWLKGGIPWIPLSEARSIADKWSSETSSPPASDASRTIPNSSTVRPEGEEGTSPVGRQD